MGFHGGRGFNFSLLKPWSGIWAGRASIFGINDWPLAEKITRPGQYVHRVVNVTQWL